MKYLIVGVVIGFIYGGQILAQEIGWASYYTAKSCQKEGTSGIWTASGEKYNENDLTCARRSREWGSVWKVTNLSNGKSVIVRQNDFGPNKKLYKKGRIIDLSKGAFCFITPFYQTKGIIKVKVERIK
jgi:rare lipoprotein A